MVPTVMKTDSFFARILAIIAYTLGWN